MDCAFTNTQETFGRAARKFLQKDCSAKLIRQLFEGDRSAVRPFWSELAKRGITGALVPKPFRGAGLTVLDVVPVLQELGSALAPGPVVETLALATPMLDQLGTSEQKQHWLPAVAAGEVAITMSLTEISNTRSTTGIQTTASRQRDAFQLNGTSSWVMDADVADLMVIAGRTSDHPETGITLFLVPADAAGVTIENVPAMDRTRHHSHVHLNGVNVGSDAVLGQVDGGWAPISQALDIATVAMCSSMVGGGGRVLEMAAEYARTRQQYGQIIGKFQGIKHKCAEMSVRVESARSALYYAAWAISSGQPNATEAVSVAKNYVSQAYTYVCGENIQIHGGIGFTWEHEAHWYLKRAKANEVQLGSPRAHRERLASVLGW